MVSSTAPISPQGAVADKEQKRSNLLSFPEKLWDMLEDAGRCDLCDIISWEMEGAAFKVHDAKRFVDLVMPRYFNQTKYKSFQRQLNLYSFQRIPRGPHKSCYWHEKFRKDSPESSRALSRCKATDGEEAEVAIDLAPCWLPASMVVEPDPIPALGVPSEKISRTGNDLSLSGFENYFQSKVIKTKQEQRDDTNAFKKASGSALKRMLDSYLEQSEGESDPNSRKLENELSDVKGRSVSSNNSCCSSPPKRKSRIATFPDKLHDILEYCEQNNLTRVVCWEMEGRAFRVRSIDMFMEHVMPLFFKQSKYESLQRQLNLYGFSRVARGPFKGCYHHNLFVKGGRQLSKGMIRRKPEDEYVMTVEDLPPAPVQQRTVSPTRSPDETSSTQDHLATSRRTCAGIARMQSSASTSHSWASHTMVSSSTNPFQQDTSMILPWASNSVVGVSSHASSAFPMMPSNQPCPINSNRIGEQLPPDELEGIFQVPQELSPYSMGAGGVPGFGMMQGWGAGRFSTR